MKKIGFLLCSMVFSLACYADSSTPSCRAYTKQDQSDCSKVVLRDCNEDKNCQQNMCGRYYVSTRLDGGASLCAYDDSADKAACKQDSIARCSTGTTPN